MFLLLPPFPPCLNGSFTPILSFFYPFHIFISFPPFSHILPFLLFVHPVIIFPSVIAVVDNGLYSHIPAADKRWFACTSYPSSEALGFPRACLELAIIYM
jgi:hypothetical protein